VRNASSISWLEPWTLRFPAGNEPVRTEASVLKGVIRTGEAGPKILPDVRYDRFRGRRRCKYSWMSWSPI